MFIYNQDHILGLFIISIYLVSLKMFNKAIGEANDN